MCSSTHSIIHPGFRWALTLSGYYYSINHRPGKHHGNANVLSRFPLPLIPQEVPESGNTILLFECLQVDPPPPHLIKTGKNCDPILARVRNFVLQGWPSQEELRKSWQEELSIEYGSVLWGSQVVVSPSACAQVFKLLHSTHLGIIQMKAGLARSYM